ncbi:MAG: histidine kinase [Aeromicrobium erythreum]
MPIPPPPLTRWGRTWRLLLMLLVSGIAWGTVARYQVRELHWWLALDVSLGVVSFVLVRWRRRYPVSVGAVTNLLTAVSTTSSGPATLALFSLSTRRRWREILPVSALAALAGGVFMTQDPSATNDPVALSVGLLVTIVAITVGWGMFVGSRRELLATLRERAETAESEQAARVAQARTTERARIAREMHDVLAHRISMIAMHAGALDFRDDLGPDEVRRTAGIIRESSHQALVELRQVLGVLRDEPTASTVEPPQPGARDVPGLVVQMRASGMNVETEGLELTDDVPDTVGRTLYRVVQEGLTNAHKHAPDTLVTVRLRGEPGDGLVVEVGNLLPVGTRPTSTTLPTSGLGLVGLAERAELVGGRLTRVQDDRSFTLRVWLPWPT